MADFFIIEDPAEVAFGLPSSSHDLPLVFTDKRVSASRQWVYAPSMMDVMSGYLGDVMLVNGTPDAWLSVDRGLYRLRLLNGSNKSFLVLNLPKVGATPYARANGVRNYANGRAAQFNSLLLGELTIAYGRPVVAGDRITVRSRGAEVQEKAGPSGPMDVIAIEDEGRAADGELVFRSCETFILRRG